MSDTYDIGVIGAGPGGYVAAIRAAQLGFRVVIIEAQATLGGTCLNWGCIPSKALLDSSEHYHNATKAFAVHGIKTGKVSVDWRQMQQRKNDVIANTTAGIDYLMAKNAITVVHGLATFETPSRVRVTASDNAVSTLDAVKWIIATGSTASEIPSVPLDGRYIIGSNEAISLPKIPKEMVVIGGGVIGVELGSVYARLGTAVTIVEWSDRLIPGMDSDLGKALRKSLSGLSITCHFKTKVVASTVANKRVQLTLADSNDKTRTMDTDVVLVAVGRRANTAGLGLEAIGLQTNERGQIAVDDQYETAVKGVYAIGDVTPGPMLAHKASEEGVVCVERMAGHAARLNYATIPGVVYTWPEVAGVGDTEDALKASGRGYKVGKFLFKASGRARAAEESEGFVKVISDAQTDEVLGVHMIGPRASDMIGEAVVAMEFRASAEDIGMITHAHPTFSEAVKEAALGATGQRPIHM
jgi:dihydrolipoamide dehydrogenase